MKSDIAGDVHIGVDVSKAKLDVYVPATKEGARPTTVEVDNAVEGFRKLRDMARKAKAVVCVEPTGGYELELMAFMRKFDVRVAYADALRVRQFARAEGSLSKNDSIDAALISRFADRIGVRLLDGQDVDSVELKRKAKFRQTMIDSRTAIICRLETETDAEMRKMLEEQVSHFDRLIRKAEDLCVETVRGNEGLNGKLVRFTAVGGIGDVTAISILAGLPEIGKLPDAKPDRLVGIAPEERQSGTREWQRKIRGGRKDVRNALYMGRRGVNHVERHPGNVLPQEARGGASPQVGHRPDHAEAAVAAEQDREGPGLRPEARTRVDEGECVCGTKEKVRIGASRGPGFPSLPPSPRTPFSPCHPFPALARRGCIATPLDKPPEIFLKFTVAVPSKAYRKPASEPSISTSGRRANARSSASEAAVSGFMP